MAKTNGIEKLRNVMEHWHTGSLVDWCRGIAYQIEREHQDALNERAETICELNREIAQLRADLAEAKRENIVARCRPCRTKREAAADWVEQQGGLDVVRDYPKMDEFVAKLAIDLGVSDDIGCGDDLRLAISEELDKRLMPQGMEWPRFEDGERVRLGDEFLWAGITYKCDSVKLGDGFALHCDNVPSSWYGYSSTDRVKRPEPEVLGADGLPIKVGETVRSKDGVPFLVDRIDYWIFGKKKRAWDVDGFWLWPEELTHTLPDTQERIDDDATRDPSAYCNEVLGWDAGKIVHRSDYAAQNEAMIADLLRRQRELDARTMGGDAS